MALTTVRSIRLVCRRFNELASPLLLPRMYLYLNQDSLDFADAVSRSPHVASGVRMVNVVLRYRPRELADDFGRFCTLAKKRLDAAAGCYVMDMSWEEAMASDLRAFGHISSVWGGANEGSDAPGDEKVDDPGSELLNRGFLGACDYQDILRRSYQDFRLGHEEQLRLINDRTFVTNLSATMARLPRTPSLSLTEESFSRSDYPYFNNSSEVLLTDKDMLCRFLASDLTWFSIAMLPYAADVPPVRLLSELPIGLYRAGAQLRDLRICVLPLSNYLALRPFTAHLDGVETTEHEQ